ncbi:unnamed protein product [Urochloa humidicola]
MPPVVAPSSLRSLFSLLLPTQPLHHHPAPALPRPPPVSEARLSGSRSHLPALALGPPLTFPCSAAIFRALAGAVAQPRRNLPGPGAGTARQHIPGRHNCSWRSSRCHQAVQQIEESLPICGYGLNAMW